MHQCITVTFIEYQIDTVSVSVFYTLLFSNKAQTNSSIKLKIRDFNVTFVVSNSPKKKKVRLKMMRPKSLLMNILFESPEMLLQYAS